MLYQIVSNSLIVAVAVQAAFKIIKPGCNWEEVQFLMFVHLQLPVFPITELTDLLANLQARCPHQRIPQARFVRS